MEIADPAPTPRPCPQPFLVKCAATSVKEEMLSTMAKMDFAMYVTMRRCVHVLGVPCATAMLVCRAVSLHRAGACRRTADRAQNTLIATTAQTAKTRVDTAM